MHDHAFKVVQNMTQVVWSELRAKWVPLPSLIASWILIPAMLKEVVRQLTDDLLKLGCYLNFYSTVALFLVIVIKGLNVEVLADPDVDGIVALVLRMGLSLYGNRAFCGVVLETIG